MKHVVVAIAAALAAAVPAAAQEAEGPRWSIALHGGAGTIERAEMSPEMDAAYRAALTRALEAGASVLADGGGALDAIQAAIEILEDDPLFNAGRGAVFTSAGANELDASIMDGATMRAGAVGGVTRTRHPIALARAVMERSPHVMLIGEGADAFAGSVGLEQVDPSFFFTERRWRALERTLEARGDPVPQRPAGAPSPEGEAGLASLAAPLDERKFGTVGVVALDTEGRIAAGTSTGGTTGKRWGRVGDTPIIGAGTYADAGCAVSATGTGEYFIRFTVARDICARLAAGASLQAAAEAEIAEIGAVGGDGGVIALNAAGEAAFAMNTSGMYRGRAAWDAPASVAIYADEE